MIIKSLEIKNIRSVRSLKLENIPPSAVLFYGDVGSGKSSTLKAMEFALFGILSAADLGGDSLLRRGENTGYVKLTIEIKGKEYTIMRSLKRTAKSVSADKASIEVDGSATSYSAKDMRRAVLALLKYPVAKYENAQKIPLYRYTVYTPQEELKEILVASADERFEILKEVFGIERYELALKQSDKAASYLKDYLNRVKGELMGIGNPAEQIPQLESRIKQLGETIGKSKQSLAKKEKEIASAKQEQDEIQARVTDIAAKQGEITSHQSIITREQGKVSAAERDIKKVTGEILTTKGKIAAIVLPEIPPDSNEEGLEKEITNLQNDLDTWREKETSAKNIIKDIEELLNTGKCPRCKQTIHERERFDGEIKDHKHDLETDGAKIADLVAIKFAREKLLKAVRQHATLSGNIRAFENILKEKGKLLASLESQRDSSATAVTEAKEAIKTALARLKIPDASAIAEELGGVQRELANQKQLLTKLDGEKTQLAVNVKAGEKDLEASKRDLKAANDMIERQKDLQGLADYLKDLREWLTTDFPQLIRDIEREVLASTAVEFNQYFQEWFHMLVEEGNIEVEINREDFQPVVHMNGYEASFDTLSGGEKSALSLAYRLALNKIIHQAFQNVQTRDLLILDEPTDGFSEQQIARMQGIFDQFAGTQIFVISHERALDSFVTDVYTFTKRNHETSVHLEKIRE